MENKMIAYTGTKTVKAAPMTRQDAGEKGLIRNYDPNCTDSNGDDGYIVEYPDGYRSWSPAKVFEEAYKVSETHIDRMKIELADLNEKIYKATKAIYTPDMINADCRCALKEQLSAMREYAEILYWRIYNAEHEPNIFSSEPNCVGKGGK